MSSDGDTKQPEDVVFMHSPTEDGAGVRVVRSKNSTLEVGELRPLREGQPVTGEIVSLTPRAERAEGAPQAYDVKVLYDARARSGPAQVATTAYRESWDTIFGPKTASDAKRAN